MEAALSWACRPADTRTETGLETEGIYRVSGRQASLQTVRRKANLSSTLHLTPCACTQMMHDIELGENGPALVCRDSG